MAVRVRSDVDGDTRSLVNEVATVVAATLRRKEDVTVVSEGLQVVMAVGQVERPDSPGFLGRVERAVLDALGNTVPVEFAAGEVSNGDDPVTVIDSMRFAAARHLPTRALVIGPASGPAALASQALTDSGLLIEVMTAEDVFQGMHTFGRFEPNLVLVDSGLPHPELQAVADQIASGRQGCRLLILTDGSTQYFQPKDLMGAQPLDPSQLVAQIAHLARSPQPAGERLSPLLH